MPPILRSFTPALFVGVVVAAEEVAEWDADEPEVDVPVLAAFGGPKLPPWTTDGARSVDDVLECSDDFDWVRCYSILLTVSRRGLWSDKDKVIMIKHLPIPPIHCYSQSLDHKVAAFHWLTTLSPYSSSPIALPSFSSIMWLAGRGDTGCSCRMTDGWRTNDSLKMSEQGIE